MKSSNSVRIEITLSNSPSSYFAFFLLNEPDYQSIKPLVRLCTNERLAAPRELTTKAWGPQLGPDTSSRF